MARPDDFGQMPTGEFARLQTLCERLEQAWKAYDGSGAGIDLEPMLPAGSDALRVPALCEFIKTEMPHRLEHSLPWDLDFYVQKYPELGGAAGVSAQLIAEECWVRKRHGMRLSLAAYQKRFPRQFPELEQLLDKPETSPIAPTIEPPSKPSGATPVQVYAAPILYGAAKGMLIGGQYEIKARLGRGAYGEVWQVLDTKGGIDKALKILMHAMDTDEAKSEEQALEQIKNLESPFILRTDSFWKDGSGRLFIVMEWARGGNLRECLKKRKQEGHVGIPAPELLRYIREAADALDYLHEKKLVHRDIKPDNILLVGNHAKIADLGLARTMSGGQTTTAGALGSAPYMAPEVWREKISKRSDQYSLAVCYAELRQGKLPFKGKKLVDFFEAHLAGTVNLDPAVIEVAEQQVLRKALTKEREQRYSSCLEFVADLERAVAQRPDRGIVPPRAPADPAPKHAASELAEPPPTRPVSSSALPPATPLIKTVLSHHEQPSNMALATPKPGALADALEPVDDDSISSQVDSGTADYPKTELPSDTDSILQKQALVQPEPPKPDTQTRTSPQPNTDSPPQAVPPAVSGTQLLVEVAEVHFGTITPNAPSGFALPLSGPKHAALEDAVRADRQHAEAADRAVPRPRRHNWLRPVAACVLLGVVVAGVWAVVSYQSLKHAVDYHVHDGQIEAAYTMAQECWPPFMIDSLHDRILSAALAFAHDNKERDPAKAEAACKEILARYQRNADAADILDGITLEKALAPFRKQLKDCTTSADFEKLVARVEAGNLDTKGRQKLLATVSDSWRGLADSQFNQGHFDQAGDTADAMLRNAASVLSPVEAKLVHALKEKAIAGKNGGVVPSKIESIATRPEVPTSMAKLALTWPDKSDWKARFQVCLKADQNDPWVRACTLECLLQSDELRRQNDTLRSKYVADLGTEVPGDEPYFRYVRALALASDKTVDGADLVQRLDTKDAWFTGERRRKAVTLLHDAARKLRQDGDGLYKGPAEAKRAYGYLSVAAKWLNAEVDLKTGVKVPAELRSELVFAALFKPAPEWVLVTSLARELLKGEKLSGQERRICALLGAVGFRDIRTALRKDERTSFETWKSDLSPMLDLADPANTAPEVQKRRALWLAAKGWLLHDHPGAVWSSKEDSNEEAYRAFDEAFGIAEKNTLEDRGECLIARISCELTKKTGDGKKNWDKLKVDAEQAIGLAPENPLSYKVLAKIYQAEAEQAPNAAKKIASLKDAYDAGLKAYQKVGNDDEDGNLHSILMMQSKVSFDLGNAMYWASKQDDCKKYLSDAASFAERLWETEPKKDRDSIQFQLGLAREDVAYYAEEEVDDNYKKAVKAFTKAIDENEDRTDALVARGRAQYRWASKKKSERKKLNALALADLEDSLKKDAPIWPEWYQSEAYYWMGMILKQTDLEQAWKKFVTPAKKGLKNDFVELASLEADKCTEKILEQGFARKDESPRDALGKAESAKRQLDDLPSKDSYKRRDLLAKWGLLVFEARQKSGDLKKDEADDILRQAIPSRNSQKATANQLKLLCKRVDFQQVTGELNTLVKTGEFAVKCLKDFPRDEVSAAEFNVLAGEAHFWAAKELLLVKNPEMNRKQALEHLQQAVSSNSKNYWYHLELANVLYELMIKEAAGEGRETYRAEAIAALNSALELSPPEEAKAKFSKAIATLKAFPSK